MSFGVIGNLMISFRNVILFSLFSAVLFSASAQEEQKDADSLTVVRHKLEEVVVTASRFDEIIPARKLAGKELERLNSLSVADAVRYFSGVQIKDYGGIGGLKSVNVRGMGTNHTGVFFNGIQLGNAQNGQIDLGRFSLENMEEIALYHGQKSDILQSAREFGNGGSIYLVSRRPRFEEGKTTNLKASIRAGSFDLINPSLLYEYKISDRVTTTLNAEWINSSGKYKFRYKRNTPAGQVAYDTTAVRQNGDIDAVRVEGSLNTYLDNGFWKVQFYHYTSERGVPGAIVNNVWKRGERVWDRNSFVQSSFRHRINPKLESVLNMKYAVDFTHYVNQDDKQLHVDNIYKQKEIYLSSANRYNILKNWETSLAYDFQWNDLSDFAEASRQTHWLSLATALTLKERFKMQASILGTFVRDKGSATDKEYVTRDAFTPALYISWQAFGEKGPVFRAFSKRSFRMPTFNDLYYVNVGNALLEPERVTQNNFGLLYDLEQKDHWFRYFQIGADIYYNVEKNKIVAYPGGQLFRWTMLNLGRVEVKGVDVTATATTVPATEWVLTAKLQYTYQDARDLTDRADLYYRDQIPYIPWNSGSAVAMVSYRSWGLNYSFIYVGGRYNQQDNIRYNYMQPWYTSDLSLSKEFRLKPSVLQVTAEVNNLLSQDYDVILNYPMPKRNFRIRLSIAI